MKATVHIIFLLIALFFSPTLFSNLEIFNASPNIFLVYIVFAGFFAQQKEAVWLGFVYGIFYDITVGANFGLNGILMMFVCFLTVLFCEYMIRRSNIIIKFIAVAFWTFFVENINFIFSNSDWCMKTFSVIGAEILYNGLILLALYIPITKIFNRMYDEKR